jgi:hypothetical protein
MIRHLTSLASMEAKSSSLMVALRNSRYPIAKYLLDSGANINHRWARNATSLLLLSSYFLSIPLLSSDSSFLLSHLLYLCSLLSEQNVTAFLKAISLSLDQTFLISLLDYHPDLDSKTPDGETTLSLAVSKNLRRFVQTLLVTGKVSSQLKGGLLTAVRSHATDLAEVLIQEGADVFVCDKYHNNVIHILMQYYPPRSRFSFLFFLEAYHRDYLKELVNKRNSEGNTPLHLLLGRDADPTTIQTLLSYGASVNIPNHAGKTPQSLAQYRRILPLLFSDAGGTNGSRGNSGNGDHTSGTLSRHSSCAIQ